MEALLKALFASLGQQPDTFDKFNPEQVIAAQYGNAGALSGKPYGMWGSMFGELSGQKPINPLKQLAPKSDSFLTALLGSD